MMQTLVAALGGMTVGDVLQHHRSDLWSESWREGYARLRAPLPLARQQQRRAVRPAPRPGFRFCALPSLGRQALGKRSLDALTYVVFDKTADSRPLRDEIITITECGLSTGGFCPETFDHGRAWASNSPEHSDSGISTTGRIGSRSLRFAAF
ncbi:hypothetical protein CCP2SC5_2130002 [Azospirillaceae bacterium]